MNVEQCRKARAEALAAAGPNHNRSIGPTLSSLAHERKPSLKVEKDKNTQPRERHTPQSISTANNGFRSSLRTRTRSSLGTSSHTRGLGSLVSPGIPRPKSTAPIVSQPSFRRHTSGQTPSPMQSGFTPRERRPLGLAEAWNLAKEHDDHGHGDETFDLKNAFDMAKAEADGVRLGSPSPAPRPQRPRKDSQELGSIRDTGRDLVQQLKKFDRNHQLANGSGPPNGLFSRTRVEPKLTEAAITLATKANEGDFGSSQESHTRKRSSESLLSEEDYERFSPLPSIEPSRSNSAVRSLGNNQPNLSPEKSYNWQLDADFTAGDLQISDSPRIKAAQTNGHEANSPSPSISSSQASDSPSSRRSDARLEQLRQLEIDVAGLELEFSDSDDSFPKKTNRRLDEIRAREMESFSKRAVATSRLDEIRIRNSEARSESQSPEVKSAVKDRPHSASFSNPDPAKENDDGGGGTIRGNPFTASKSLDEKRSNKASNHDAVGKSETNERQSRNDSFDLLRQLARATSASPSPPNTKTIEEPFLQATTIKQESSERETARPHFLRDDNFLRDDKRPRNLEAKSSRERPTVGFAGLPKNLSSESLSEKRRNLATSEPDPVDRIEAEMNLFAPHDKYSEKGSIRALSPAISETADMDEEETPRPDRVMDPLSQPTPRVTGAYVETPATVKVKAENGGVTEKMPEAKGSLASRLLFGSRSRTSSKSDSESKVPDIKKEGGEGPGRAGRSGLRVFSRRTGSRAGSRRRRPLINTAQIPTPKEDLRAILRQNRIDDSTLDDVEFDRLLAGSNLDHDELEKVVNETILAVEEGPGVLNATEREEELERQRIDRMSKSLKTGLLNIRCAKQGIERLEDKVSHSERQKPSTLAADMGKSNSSGSQFPAVQPHASDSAMYLPIPRIYRRKPRFAFTPFGLLSVILLIWYTLESAFCFLYVAHYECTPSYPCDWSPHEPYFPYAMPFMLDEWATGGKGRELAWRVGEEVGDLAAEVSDWMTGNDFTKEDTMYMDAWERKRHWRRLRKKGLIKKWVEPPEYREKIRGWKEAFKARERARENGDDWGYEMLLSEDERL